MQPPAIAGGKPIRDQFLPYARPSIGEKEIEAVVRTLRGMWLTTGPLVTQFEEKFAAWQGVTHAVAVSSGTAALAAATFACGFGPGDEVITTALTFAATANCIAYTGARPVLADIDPRTLCISPDSIRRRLTTRTKGIIVVHFAGQPAEMDEIGDLAADRDLLVIEDACHAPGATYKGRKVGALGHVSCYSFHAVKPITTGEGGMVVTDIEALATTAARYRNHGITIDARQRLKRSGWEYDVSLLGQNYRLTDFQCAIGIEQLEGLPASLARRESIAATYRKAFEQCELLELIHDVPDTMHGRHLFPILLRLDRLKVDRSHIFKGLHAEKIGVNVHYIPIHFHSWYRDRFSFAVGDYPVTEEAYSRLLSLPLFAGMTDADVEDVITAVLRLLTYYKA